MTTKTTPYDVYTAVADAVTCAGELNFASKLLGLPRATGSRSIPNMRALIGMQEFVDVYGHPVRRGASYEVNNGVFSKVRPQTQISLQLLPLARNAHGVK